MEPIQLEQPFHKSRITQQVQQPLNKFTVLKSLQKITYSKTIQFYRNRVNKAKQLNKPSTFKHLKQQSQLKKQIRLGLGLQSYLGQSTNFYQHYIQQFQDNFNQLRYKPRRIGLRKSQKIFTKLLEKNRQACQQFYYPLNWIRQQCPSYPQIIKNPLSLLQIKQKLKQNKYQSTQQFFIDMNKFFNQSFIYNFYNQEFFNQEKNYKEFQKMAQNKKYFDMTTKLRDNFLQIVQEVFQKRNLFKTRFYQPQNQYEFYETIDIQQEIQKYKKTVNIDQDQSEYLFYDIDYFNDKQKAGQQQSGMLQHQSNHQISQRLNSFDKKKPDSNKKTDTKKHSFTPHKFQSYQAANRIIQKSRLMKLSNKIKQVISIESKFQIKERRQFSFYLRRKIKQIPNLIDNSQQISLEKLEYEEFVDFECFVQDLMVKYDKQKERFKFEEQVKKKETMKIQIVKSLNDTNKKEIKSKEQQKDDQDSSVSDSFN